MIAILCNDRFLLLMFGETKLSHCVISATYLRGSFIEPKRIDRFIRQYKMGYRHTKRHLKHGKHLTIQCLYFRAVIHLKVCKDKMLV